MENSLHTVRISNGNLYIENNIYSTYFKNIGSVALLYSNPMVMILPVQKEGNGGMLLKIKNAKGDRVVNILEFLENYNLDGIDKTFPVVWSSEKAALTFNTN